MFMKVCLCLLLALLVATSAANLRDGTSNSQERGQDSGNGELLESLRRLAESPCTKGDGLVFSSTVAIAPGTRAKTCSAASLVSIGQIINTTIAIADKKYMQGSNFVSGVCEVPSTSKNQTRRLAASGFVWKGGGVSHNHVVPFVHCPLFVHIKPPF